MVMSPQGLNMCGMQVQLFSVLEVSYFHFSLRPTQTLVLWIKHVWNASTAFFSVRGILLPLFFTAYTDASPVDALKVQSSNSSTKVSRDEVHLLSEGVTRGLSVRLTCRSMHLCCSDPVVAIPPLN